MSGPLVLPSYPTWLDARLEVGLSRIHGRGLFARQPIPEGEVLLVWGGSLFTQAEVQQGLAIPYSTAVIDEGMYLGDPVGGESDYDQKHPDYHLNHSCDPNLWLLDAVTLAARRDIAAGEELFADYAFWEADPAWMLSPCRCGSPLCRGRVTGDDWQIPELQRRYEGHFSPYINRRIQSSLSSEGLPSANAAPGLGNAARLAQIERLFTEPVASLGMFLGDDFTMLEVNCEWMFRFPRNPQARYALENEKRFLPIFSPMVDLPVPDYTWQGPGFAGYRKLPGVPLTAWRLRPLPPERRQALAQRIGEFLSVLHNFPLPQARSLGLSDGWGGWRQQAYQVFRSQVEGRISLPARRRAQDTFQRFFAAHFTPTVIHGDFTPDGHILFRTPAQRADRGDRFWRYHHR